MQATLSPLARQILDFLQRCKRHIPAILPDRADGRERKLFLPCYRRAPLAFVRAEVVPPDVDETFGRRFDEAMDDILAEDLVTESCGSLHPGPWSWRRADGLVMTLPIVYEDGGSAYYSGGGNGSKWKVTKGRKGRKAVTTHRLLRPGPSTIRHWSKDGAHKFYEITPMGTAALRGPRWSAAVEETLIRPDVREQCVYVGDERIDCPNTDSFRLIEAIAGSHPASITATSLRKMGINTTRAKNGMPPKLKSLYLESGQGKRGGYRFANGVTSCNNSVTLKA